MRMETEDKKSNKRAPRSRGGASTMLEKEISAVADWLEYLGHPNLATLVREGKYKDPAVAARVKSMLNIKNLERELNEAKKQHQSLGASEDDDDPVTVISSDVPRMTLRAIPAPQSKNK